MAAILRLTTGIAYLRSIAGSYSITGNVTQTGHYLFSPDNTYDIGASGATRPRNYFGAGAITSAGTVTIGDGSSFSSTSRGAIQFPADGVFSFTNNAGSGFTSLNLGIAGTATSYRQLQKKVTAIADNTATTVFTVTVPNANHAARIKLYFLSSNGSTDAFESARAAEGTVVVTRTASVDTVATALAISDAVIATVGSGATHTLAYAITAMSGLSSATQTFTIQVTIDDSGNTGANQIVAIAHLVNAEAAGVTIA